MTVLSGAAAVTAMFELVGSRAASIYFLSALLMVGSVTSPTVCPTQCACADVVVDCRFRSLSDAAMADMADRLPPEVEELDVGDNAGVTTVNRATWPLLSGLRLLRLDGCRLHTVETYANIRSSINQSTNQAGLLH